MTDYVAGFLDVRESEEVEEHLFACPECAKQMESLIGLSAAIRAVVPLVLSAERFDALDREGRIGEINAMSPEDAAEVQFPDARNVLVHRLGGADLARAKRVNVEIADLDGTSLVRYDDVPFDRTAGEVLLACQSHFADVFPHDIVVRVEVLSGDSRDEAREYRIFHRS